MPFLSFVVGDGVDVTVAAVVAVGCCCSFVLFCFPADFSYLRIASDDNVKSKLLFFCIIKSCISPTVIFFFTCIEDILVLMTGTYLVPLYNIKIDLDRLVKQRIL